MGGSELLFILLGWALPLAVAAFIVTSVVRITRSLGSIERELGGIREVLEKNSTT